MSNKSSICPICPKCGSSNISFQIMPKTIKGSFGGCSCLVIIFLLMIPVVGWIFLLLGSSKYKVKNVTYALCSSCGHTWRYWETKEKIKLIITIVIAIIVLFISIFIMINSILSQY